MTDPLPADTTQTGDNADDPSATPHNTETSPTDDHDTDGSLDADTPNTEAARYRRRLRDTETQLQTTAERLTAYQRRHAEQLVADVLATPADLFEVGQHNLTDFIDEDTGDLRTDELHAAATLLVEQRPQLGTNYQPPLPAGTDFGQGVRSQSLSGASWASVLADQRHRQ